MQITIDHLSKTYRGKVQALKDVTLDIHTGMFGLLGPNGAGKTTLMSILATLVKPSGGRALVDGFDVTDARGKWAVKRVLGYLPQELGLYPDLNPYEFLDYIATLKGLHGHAQRKYEVARLLELTGLAPVARRRIKVLSGGMKRRLGIAQAFIGDPKLLIVDEPTVGLDPEERVRFRTLLAELSGERIVILSTHIVEDVAATCHDLAVMQRGEIHFRGSPQALLREAQGKVWELNVNGGAPDPAWRMVSSVRGAEGTRLRVLGQRPTPEAREVAPTLEEAYLALIASQAT
jgi:ABC-type multidrug transport system ATPase subunit